MSHATTDLKHEIQKSLSLLQTLRDEIRVKVHLAGMEAKTQWSKLEPQLAETERAAETLISESARTAVDEALATLKKFRQSL